ncbi:MAG: DUF4302 domain-containing protein [Paludibacteraceae bacterium]|nr:DUF4302 domain-containing protein [Paludibacteraceae bacterium]
MKMKTNILLLVAVSALFIGCNRDDKDLFDESANARLNNALKNAENSFVSAANGWEILYFPNKESCGYNLLARFSDDGRVSVATSNSLTTHDRFVQDDNSTWVVKADYGPILSFDTYNQVLHAWADPQTDGDGYLGDYEFLILKANNNEVRLKGKKHEAYTQMFPLERGVDWKDYFAQVRAYRDLLFTGNDGMKMTIVGNGRELKYIYKEGILQDPDSLGTEYYPLIVRPNCIQLYDKGFDGAIHFVLNDEKDKLICTDEGHRDVVILPGFEPIEYFVSRFNQKNSKWIYVADGSSSAVTEAMQTINAAAAAHNIKVTRVAFDRFRPTSMADTITALRISYSVNNRLYEGYIRLQYDYSGEQVSFAAGAADASLNALLTRIAPTAQAGAKMFTDIFCGTYTVSSRSGSQFNMINMNMTTTDGSKTIHVVADNETI